MTEPEQTESSCCNAGPGTEANDVREAVRERYAAAARSSSVSEPVGEGCCSPTTVLTTDASGNEIFGAALYADPDVSDEALAASLGCGVPTAVANLQLGETVLDLGSGGGADVLISARRVGPNGRAIGLDMTDEMLELARGNAAKAGVTNVEFIKGYIEDIPLPDASVDTVISNCVLNLSADKPTVLREAVRVLRPRGHFAISDVVADDDMDEATRTDMQQWTGCIAGALTRTEFELMLAEVGLEEIDIRETHRVHAHASAAIIRATKPSID